MAETPPQGGLHFPSFVRKGRKIKKILLILPKRLFMKKGPGKSFGPFYCVRPAWV
jgi:hypothetical protein